MWLVTHSDALLREAIATPRATVLLMQEIDENNTSANQLRRVRENRDEELAILELVGDIAGYRPKGKIVIFEGEDAGFDVRMTSRLFPDYARTMNFIAGGNKIGVERLHQCLDDNGHTEIKVYSITDRDKETTRRSGRRRYSWDSYHIENYLLEPTYIADVIGECTTDKTILESGEIEEILQEFAQRQVDILLREKLNEYVNGVMVRKININVQDTSTLSSELMTQINQSKEQITQTLSDELKKENIESEVTKQREYFEHALQEDEWKQVFRGRDILACFCREYGQGLPYVRLRDMIVNRMQQRGHQPGGMRKILRQIANDGS